MTFAQVLNEMSDLYTKKNSDYGNSFDTTMDEFGIVASVVRMSDKMNRIKSLIKGSVQEVTDEKLEDTIMDLANYAVMTYVWLKNKQS